MQATAARGTGAIVRGRKRRVCHAVLAMLLLVGAAAAESGSTESARCVDGTQLCHPFYVSVVMCGRHDDKRGDYAGRLQNSLDFLLHQAARFAVRMEIIVVEWNPLPGASRLVSLLRVPPRSRAKVRVVTVPREFHDRVEAGTGEGFFEFMAKNVGARRARGRFVLFTNGDVLLSDALMEMLAREMLLDDAFYRVPRSEAPGLMDPLAPLNMRRSVLDELIDMHAAEQTCPVGQHECAGEYNRGVCEAGGGVGGGGAPNDSGDRHMGLEDEPFLPAAGDFFLISSAALHRMGGYHQVPRCASLCACMPSCNVQDCVHVCLYLCMIHAYTYTRTHTAFQVASTTHLDSMLVCKARGMSLRQVAFSCAHA